MRLFYAVFIALAATNSSAATWPLHLADLQPEQLAAIEDRQLAGFTTHDFRFVSDENTVGEHSIVTYGVQNVLVTCNDGTPAYDHHYILLYVKDQTIKHATNFSQYGCDPERNK